MEMERLQVSRIAGAPVLSLQAVGLPSPMNYTARLQCQALTILLEVIRRVGLDLPTLHSGLFLFEWGLFHAATASLVRS